MARRSRGATGRSDADRLRTRLAAAPRVTPQLEVARLDEHFRRVISGLRQDEPAGLCRAQRRSRGRQLAELERYSRRRRFPRNTRFPALRLPHFMDQLGTRCAMAHLLEQSGAGELVRHIAVTRNFDRIDVLDMPELRDWLERNGLTVEEAQRIQPEYCFYPAQGCVCYLVGITTSWLEGNLVESDAGLQLEVVAVYGGEGTVTVGDAVAVPQETPTVRPHVLASWQEPSAIVHFGFTDAEKAYPSGGCYGSGVGGTAPTGLPKEILLQALTGSNCEGVLAAYNPAWGDPSCPAQSSAASSGSGGSAEEPPPGTVQRSDGGCTFGRGGADGAVGLLIAGICIVRACRHTQRRRRPSSAP